MTRTITCCAAIGVGLAVCLPPAALPPAAATPGAADAAILGQRPARDAAAQKKKRKKKATATVNATWSVERSGELNGGTESEKITFTVKDAKAVFKRKGDTNAVGNSRIKIVYEARFYTEDRSYAIGCETEQRNTTATFNSDLDFYVFPVRERTAGGKVQKLAQGWAVSLADPRRADSRNFRPVTTGFYQEWFSLLQDDCRQYPINQPLGGWNPYFVTSWTATGKLNGGGKGVLLTQPNTGVDQTGTVQGTIKFSEDVSKRGSGGAGGSVSLN